MGTSPLPFFRHLQPYLPWYIDDESRCKSRSLVQGCHGKPATPLLPPLLVSSFFYAGGGAADWHACLFVLVRLWRLLHLLLSVILVIAL